MNSKKEYVDGVFDDARKDTLMQEGLKNYKARRYQEALAIYEKM